jgi:hypothetical protein
VASTESHPSAFKPGLYEHYKGGLYIALHLARHHDGQGYYVVYVCCKHGTISVREWDTPGKKTAGLMKSWLMASRPFQFNGLPIEAWRCER